MPLLALATALVAAGCGDSGGGVIKPEASTKSPMGQSAAAKAETP
jgi:hypothetical protein